MGINALLSKQVIVMNQFVQSLIKNDSILLTDIGLHAAKQLNLKLQLLIYLTEQAKLERELRKKDHSERKKKENGKL